MKKGYDIGTHWRDSTRIPRLFLIDARAVLFLFPFVFHPTRWTLLLCVIVLVVLGVLEYFKMTLPIALRSFRSVLSGSHKFRNRT